jgi:hypothetical protein
MYNVMIMGRNVNIHFFKLLMQLELTEHQKHGISVFNLSYNYQAEMKKHLYFVV